MRRSWSWPFFDRFDRAFKNLKRDFQSDPFRYLTKWDIICQIYRDISEEPCLAPVETGRYTFGKDGRWRLRKEEEHPLRTCPVHVMLGKEMGDRPRADICFLDLETMQVGTTVRYNERKPTSISSWRFGAGIGLSVIHNMDVQYARRMNTGTGRSSKTVGFKELESNVISEINSLKEWDKAILLIVDNHSLYTKLELEDSFSKRLNPYTIRIFYVTPKSGFHITGKRKPREQREDVAR